MDTNKAESPEKPKMNKKRRRVLSLLAAFFLLIGILGGGYWLGWGRFEIYTDDAYVSGNSVQLMPQIAGTVVAINTDDTHFVEVGQPLLKLDDANTQIALQHAEADLAATVRQVRQYYEDVRQNQAVFILRQANLSKAQADVQRRLGLVHDHAISREELQHYQNALDVAKAQNDYALHKLIAAVSLVEHASLYQHPIIERAKANFKNAYLNQQRTIIRSPVSGYVAKRSIEVGQQVVPNTVLLAVVPLDTVWIEANYKENQLARIRIGQPVILTTDANHITYHGKVVGLDAGTGSAFALLPAQNATGNWIKIVQRVPVRIALDAQEVMQHPLQIGLSVRATIDTHRLKGEALSRVADHTVLYSTDIYRNQLAEADQKINAILQANAPNLRLQGLMDD